MRAEWDKIQVGQLLRQADRNTAAYGLYAVVESINLTGSNKSLKLFWTHSDKPRNAALAWTTDISVFEMIHVVPANYDNWIAGAKVMCVYGGGDKYRTGVAVRTRVGSSINQLTVTWDDGTIGDGYSNFSSFVIIEESPIEKVPATKPSPQPIVAQQSVPLPPGFDWNKYNGIVKPKPTEQVMGVVNFDTYNNGPKRIRRA